MCFFARVNSVGINLPHMAVQLVLVVFVLRAQCCRVITLQLLS